MFEWKVEDMVLMNQKSGLFLGKEKIYNCESKVSREDKIAFVDNFQDGKLSYLLYLIDKFNEDYDSLTKTKSKQGEEKNEVLEENKKPYGAWKCNEEREKNEKTCGLFYSYRTPRRYCYYCDSGGNAAPRPELRP